MWSRLPHHRRSCTAPSPCGYTQNVRAVLKYFSCQPRTPRSSSSFRMKWVSNREATSNKLSRPRPHRWLPLWKSQTKNRRRTAKKRVRLLRRGQPHRFLTQRILFRFHKKHQWERSLYRPRAFGRLRADLPAYQPTRNHSGSIKTSITVRWLQIKPLMYLQRQP